MTEFSRPTGDLIDMFIASQLATHTAQRDQKETVADATDFMKFHRALLDEPVRDKR